jgi:hypothetical protein
MPLFLRNTFVMPAGPGIHGAAHPGPASMRNSGSRHKAGMTQAVWGASDYLVSGTLVVGGGQASGAGYERGCVRRDEADFLFAHRGSPIGWGRITAPAFFVMPG